jgi:hypothetical protein
MNSVLFFRHLAVPGRLAGWIATNYLFNILLLMDGRKCYFLYGLWLICDELCSRSSS